MINSVLGLSNSSEGSSESSEYDVANILKQNVMYFDFETTGLNPYHDKVIELCFLNDISNVQDKKSLNSTDTGSVFEEEFCITSLVNPKRKFEEKITDITGIHPYDLINKPSIDELYPIITHFLDNNKQNYLIAHNCHGFDEIILKNMLKNADSTFILQNIKFMDTLLLSRKLMPELKRYNQRALCDYFKIKTKSHRADEDCKALQEIYHNLLKVYIKRVSTEFTFVELLENPQIIYDFLYTY